MFMSGECKGKLYGIFHASYIFTHTQRTHKHISLLFDKCYMKRNHPDAIKMNGVFSS